jgi:hypothetical protein
VIPAYLGGRPVPAARPFVRPAAAHLRERFILYGYAPPTEARVAGELFQVGTRGRHGFRTASGIRNTLQIANIRAKPLKSTRINSTPQFFVRFLAVLPRFFATYKSAAPVPCSEVQTKNAGPPVLACALITNGHSNLRVWRKLALMAWAVDVH